MADLARKAGVSIASVSRALSNAPGVSDETRQRIRDLCAEMGYTVAPEASRPKRGKIARVAVVLRSLDIWFYSSMVQGIMTGLRHADLDVLLCQVETEEERRQFIEDLPARRQVDALIFVALPISDSEMRRLDLLDVAVVIAGGTLGDYPHVRIDDVLAARQAVNHLVLAGHERIAMLNAGNDWTLQYAPPAERRRGFTSAMHDAGLPVDPELMVEVPFGPTGGAEGMDRLLSIDPPPTAVLAFSDEVAIGAMRSLRRAAVPVPAGMSLIGIDDHPMAELTDLTTVHQPVHEQGERAGRLVLDMLTGAPVDATHLTLPTKLVIRGTTAPPRTSARPSVPG